jgi:hypothetical protein
VLHQVAACELLPCVAIRRLLPLALPAQPQSRVALTANVSSLVANRVTYKWSVFRGTSTFNLSSGLLTSLNNAYFAVAGE